MLRREVLLSICAPLLGVLFVSGCAKKRRAAALPAQPPAPRPASTASPTEIGLASWYGHPYHGRRAASGEIYDMEKLTAAHRTLPFNTWVRVTNLSNGKTVEVRITDRGPFAGGRIIDLSHAAARQIDLIGPGVAMVRIDTISAPSPAAVVVRYGVQAGAFQDRERAEKYRASLERSYGIARIVFRDGNPPLWRVLAGSEDSIEHAAALAQRIQTEAGACFVVRLDDIAAPAGSESR